MMFLGGLLRVESEFCNQPQLVGDLSATTIECSLLIRFSFHATVLHTTNARFKTGTNVYLSLFARAARYRPQLVLDYFANKDACPVSDSE
jgi:hypothetical protein